MLVTGSVIIGRREEGQSDARSEGEGLVSRAEDRTQEEESDGESYKDCGSGEEEDGGLVSLEPGESKLDSPEKSEVY